MNITSGSALRDFILVLDDAVPVSISERLFDEYEPCDRWIPATVESDRRDPNVRNCDVLEASDPKLLSDSPVRKQLAADVTNLTARWAAQYEAATSPIGLSGHTGLGLVRYGPGGFYRSHHDNHTSEIRTVTVISVLHSEFTGGELSFFRGDHVVALEPGQLCMFPATFQYPHSVEPVETGTRYSLITWLN